MKNIFTDNEEGKIVYCESGKRLIWHNEDNRGKTSIEFVGGDIWIIPTGKPDTTEGFKIVRRVFNNGKLENIEEKKYNVNWFKPWAETEVWELMEKEIDKMLSKLGY